MYLPWKRNLFLLITSDIIISLIHDNNSTHAYIYVYKSYCYSWVLEDKWHIITISFVRINKTQCILTFEDTRIIQYSYVHTIITVFKVFLCFRNFLLLMYLITLYTSCITFGENQFLFPSIMHRKYYWYIILIGQPRSESRIDFTYMHGKEHA